MSINRRNLTIPVAIVAAGLAFTGCTSDAPQTGADGQELTTFEFQLNFAPGGFNAGFAYALQEGYYEDEGLSVTITPGTGSAVTAQMVAAGEAKVAYADAATTAGLIAKGAPMQNIMTIYQSSPNQLTVLEDSDVDTLADLKGKSIGVPSGGSQTAMFPLLLEANDLKPSDINEVGLPGTSLVQALMQGKVDAILGSTDSYGVQLEQQGAKVRNWTFAENGVPTVSTSVFGNTEFMEQNPEQVKAFLRASSKGWADVIAEPELGAAAVKEVFPDSNEEQSLMELEAIEPLYCAADAEFVGKAPEASWVRTQDLLSSVGLLPSGTDPSIYYTYDYLPADADLQACADGMPVPIGE
jgi:NitT/TauT family transport system substrate-binding protein